MAQIFASERGTAAASAASKSGQTNVQQDAAGHAMAGLAALQLRADNSPVVQRLAQWTGRGVAQLEARDGQEAGGLPADLRSGVETLSGMDMGDVQVHRNSSDPARINAHAYAQGTDIHLASGQEKHLPHEAWHAVQQKQGRVSPTRQLKAGVAINDDAGLEKEADLMGAKAAAIGAQKVAGTKDG